MDNSKRTTTNKPVDQHMLRFVYDKVAVVDLLNCETE